MRRVLIAATALFACSAPDEINAPRLLLGNARLLCRASTSSCFGDRDAAFYATSDSRERVVADLVASLPNAKVDPTLEEGAVTAIMDGDRSVFLVYAPDEGSEWFHANCASAAARTIVEVDHKL